jgi:ComF family protein
MGQTKYLYKILSAVINRMNQNRLEMNIFARFIDIIYPPRCHICRSFISDDRGQNPHFCSDCLASIAMIRPPLCTTCGIPFHSFSDENHLCERCLRKRPFFDKLRAPYLYQGQIMEAIHQMKYGGKPYLAKSLGALLASFASDWLEDHGRYLMIPVPLHPQRLRERGYNQSLLLSRVMSPLLGMDIDLLSLRRVKYTRSQTGLNSEERKRNVRGAFALEKSKEFKGRSIILVDDVATTGYTMNECARVLKKAGCDKVLCLVLARTEAY